MNYKTAFFVGWIFAGLAVCQSNANADDPDQPVDVEEVIDLSPYREKAMERWDDDIRKLEQFDNAETYSKDSLLILGSSSIRLWKNAENDLAPYRVIRRGYGGAKFSDVAVFAERLIQPHQFRGMVMFVGNDISGNESDLTLKQIEPLVRHIVSVSHAHQPKTPVFLIEVTPTLKRFDVWPEIRQLNAMLREVALSTPDTFFIATAGHVLDRDGNPRPELFRDDKLHLSEAGYTLWSSLIYRRLNEVFQLIAKTSSENG